MKKVSLLLILLLVSGSVLATDAADTEQGAELLFLLSAEGKKDLIENLYLDDEDFTHSNPNALVVKNKTKLDISFIQSLEGVQTQCFSGPVTQAKDVVDQLILNADGNGDSWLDMMNVRAFENKVVAEYSLIIEAEQPQHYEFEISSCEQVSKPKPKDPLFGKFEMCDEEIVRLPESVYEDLKRISESQNMTAMKLDLVKGLFRKIAITKSPKPYCEAVAQVNEISVQRCQEAMMNEALLDERILNLTKSNAKPNEVLCSLSEMIRFIISPF